MFVGLSQFLAQERLQVLGVNDVIELNDIALLIFEADFDELLQIALLPSKLQIPTIYIILKLWLREGGGQLLFDQDLELNYDPVKLANGVNTTQYDQVDRSIKYQVG